MNKNSKGFAHLFLVIVIVLVGLGGLLFYSLQKGYITTSPTPIVSPTPSELIDEIANWKTYENEIYKFSIKYPTDWEIKEVVVRQSESDETQILLSKKNSDRIGDFIIFIATSAETGARSAESGYNDFRGNSLFNGYPADLTGIRGEEDARPEDRIDVKSPESENYITIIFDYKSTDKKELIDQILSTFKFSN